MNPALHPGQRRSRLTDCIGQTFILAYKEDTTVLDTALKAAGCDCEVLRQVHQPGQETYSRSFLCLLNHRQAWERALRANEPTLIVEADFVPVRNFGQLPPAFDPADPNLGIAWLYTCAPQVYRITPTGYAVGYSTAMVAYVITPRSAQCLIDLANAVAQDPGPLAYSPWDSGIDYYLSDRGFVDYVPFRNYGEHGGVPNPEHRQNRLSVTHRADVLYGPLSFCPPYAQPGASSNPRLDYLKGRLYGRIKGLGRFLLGKYLRVPVLMDAHRPLPVAWFALRRQLTLWL